MMGSIFPVLPVEAGDPLFGVGDSPPYELLAFMIGLIWLCLVHNRPRWYGLAGMGFAVLSLGRQLVPHVHTLGEAYQMAWRSPSGNMAVMHQKRAGYETDIRRRRVGLAATDRRWRICRISFSACRIELQSGAELALVTNARHLTTTCGAVDVVLAPYYRATYLYGAHLFDRRVLQAFATTLVCVERTKSRLHFVTHIPDANAMRICQRHDAQASWVV